MFLFSLISLIVFKKKQTKIKERTSEMVTFLLAALQIASCISAFKLCIKHTFNNLGSKKKKKKTRSALYWADCTVSPWESVLSFSMYAWTDLHSARMFPSPKPVAPLRSISSRKKVSSAKRGFVNTWRRYLTKEQNRKVDHVEIKHFEERPV